MEYRTLTRAEMAPPELLHPDMIVLPEADGSRHTCMLHQGLRFRTFRHAGHADRRIIDFKGGHVASESENSIVVSMDAEALRGLARKLFEIARELDGQASAARTFGAKS